MNEFFIRERIHESLALSVVHNTLHKTNYLTLFFCMPLSADAASEAALLAHLITNSSEDYPEMHALRRALASLYSASISASTSAIGDTLILTVHAEFLKDRYAPKGADILHGVLNFIRSFLRSPRLENGTFSPALVALEKKNAADDARAVFDNKGRYARRRHIEFMYKSDSFSASPLGKAEIIESLTPERATEAFYKMLSHAPVEAIFVGEADKQQLKNALLSCFDSLQKEPIIPAASKVGEVPADIQNVVEKTDVKQAHLCLGFRTPIVRGHADHPAFTVASMLYGSGLTSKLFVNVRERLSLCYSIAGIYTAQKGFLQVYAGIDAEKRDVAQEEILRQLKKMQTLDISDEELSHAKSELTGSFRTLAATPSSIAAWALPRVLAGVDADPEKEISSLLAVTKEEAGEAFCTLRPDTFYCLQKEEA
ncbi:MAG: insulinase family protein [Clostridia bacterium]|nr:insulinase family protein [Clostridia bacterium]